MHVKLDAARSLIEKGLKTLGVDYLSVKKFGGNEEVHVTIIGAMTSFEGLILSKEQPGMYIVCGLPLAVDYDGGPARAILIEPLAPPGI